MYSRSHNTERGPILRPYTPASITLLLRACGYALCTRDERVPARLRILPILAGIYFPFLFHLCLAIHLPYCDHHVYNWVMYECMVNKSSMDRSGEDANPACGQHYSFPVCG